jgi:hypothetical protein
LPCTVDLAALLIGAPKREFAYAGICLCGNLPMREFAYAGICLCGNLPMREFAYAGICLCGNLIERHALVGAVILRQTENPLGDGIEQHLVCAARDPAGGSADPARLPAVLA